NDATERDPAEWVLWGTNQAIVSTDNSRGNLEDWTIIASGSFTGPNSLPLARNTLGPVISFTNTTSYTSYRMIFPDVRDAGDANSMQFNEIQFFADVSGSAGTMRIEAGGTGDP